MQGELNNITPDQEFAKRPVSIGVILTNARKHAALSQADVAAQINLSTDTIKALEEDTYKELPEPTYTRGYLRNYARTVGIDAEDLISLYRQQHRTESKIVLTPGLRSEHSRIIFGGAAAILIILVSLLVAWWMQVARTPEQNVELASDHAVTTFSTLENDNTAQASNIQTNDGSEAEASSMEKVLGKIPLSEQETAAHTTPDEQLIADVEQTTEKAIEIEDDPQNLELVELIEIEDDPQDPELVKLNDGTDILTVTCVEESWIEIRDTDQNLLMYDLIELGAVRSLRGKVPFHVLLGNSPGVVIEVNGQRFDHSQYANSNRTARFQIPDGAFN